MSSAIQIALFPMRFSSGSQAVKRALFSAGKGGCFLLFDLISLPGLQACPAVVSCATSNERTCVFRFELPSRIAMQAFLFPGEKEMRNDASIPPCIYAFLMPSRQCPDELFRSAMSVLVTGRLHKLVSRSTFSAPLASCSCVRILRRRVRLLECSPSNAILALHKLLQMLFRKLSTQCLSLAFTFPDLPLVQHLPLEFLLLRNLAAHSLGLRFE